MSEGAIVLLAVLVLGWSLTSRRLEAVGLSGPILFVAAGALLTGDRFGLQVEVEAPTVHTIAELTLALVLFSDASKVRMRLDRHDVAWPSRLLFVGLPLSMVAGTVVALLLFGELGWETAALCGAALAATDAALSSQVLADERVPARVRRTLNVESGLNDGLATPAVVLLIAATATTLGLEGGEAATHPLRELAVGVAIGAVLSLVASRAIVTSLARRWVGPGGTRLAVLALAVLCFTVAVAVEGNGFVAAFVGGFVFGRAQRDADELVELPELVADALSWTTWFIFGATLIEPALRGADWRTVVYAALSLTLVRMVPVLVAMVRSGANRPTVLFLGWFGPRGLASVVFALLIAEELPPSDPVVQTVLSAIGVTVLLSIVVHGVTTSAVVKRFAGRLS